MATNTGYWRVLCLVCCLVAQNGSATASHHLTEGAHIPLGTSSARHTAVAQATFVCHLRLVGVEAQRHWRKPSSCTIPGYSASATTDSGHLFAVQEAHMLCNPGLVPKAGGTSNTSTPSLTISVDESGRVADLGQLRANLSGVSLSATHNPQADCGLEDANGCMLYFCWTPGKAPSAEDQSHTRVQMEQHPSHVPPLYDVVVTVDAASLQRFLPPSTGTAAVNLLCFGGGIKAAVVNSTFNNNQGLISVHCHGNSTCFVHNSTFGDSLSSVGVQASGNAVVWVGNSTFCNNSNEPCVASKTASLKVVGHAAVSTLNGTVFHGNIEGAVATYQQGSLFLSETAFLNNTALLAPAVVLHDHGQCTIFNDVVFKSNRALDVGGAILMRDTTHLLINTSKAGQQIKAHGHCPSISNCLGQTCASGALFDHNSCTYNKPPETIACAPTTGVIFLENSASEQGGSIYLDDNSTVIVAENASCIFEGGSSFSGGVITATKGSSVILQKGANVVFTNNAVLSAGGAISLAGDSHLKSDASLLFLNNTSGGSGGAVCAVEYAAFYLGGHSYFCLNTAWRGGALFVKDSASVVTTGVSKLQYSTARDSGGAIYASDYSNITLSGNVDLAYNNASVDGGGVLLSRHVSTVVSGSVVCAANAAFTGSGGCISAQGDVQILFKGNGTMSMHHNSAVRNGGGMHASGHCLFSISNSSRVTLDKNTAHDGGGLAVVNGAQLQLLGDAQLMSAHNAASGIGGGCHIEGVMVMQPSAHLSVRGNSANVSGGGIFVGQQQVPGTQVAAIALAQDVNNSGSISNFYTAISGSTNGSGLPDRIARLLAKAAVFNTAPSNKDLAITPSALRPLTPISFPAYVSRRRLEDGLLPLAIFVGGAGNTPVQGVVLSASYGGGKDMIGGTVISNQSGVANFSGLKLQDQPGTYTVTVRAGSQPQLQAVHITVHIRRCVKGEVCQDSNMAYCEPCANGTYSFNPSNTSCDACPEAATCAGGNMLVPLEGFWHSAPDSPQVHRCLNAAACGGSRLQLENWQKDSHLVGVFAGSHGSTLAVSTYLQLQCTEGHTGPLCAGCLPGFGLERAFACNRCMASATWVALFVLAALLSCGVIRVLAHLTWAENNRSVAAALSPPAQATPSNQSLGSPALANLRSVGSNRLVAAAVSPPAQATPSNQSLGSPALAPLRSAEGNRAEAAAPEAAFSRQSMGSHPSQFSFLSGRNWSSPLGVQPARVTPGDVLKAMVVFIQYCFIIGSMPVEWPVALSACFTALSWLWSSSNGQALSIDCMPPFVQRTSSSQRALARVLFHLLSPAALVLLLMIMECVVRQAKRHLQAKRHVSQLCEDQQQSQMPLKDHLVIIAMVSLFFFYPALVQVIFSLFVCVEVDDPGFVPYSVNGATAGSYWAFDMNQACWEGYHKAWATGVGLLAGLPVLMGVPAAIAWLLQANMARLTSPLFSARYNFLYRCYGEHCVAWGIIELVETVALVAVAVFGRSLGLHYQALLMNCVLAVMLLLLLIYRPYAAPQLQRLRVAGLACLLVASYVVLTFIMPTALTTGILVAATTSNTPVLNAPGPSKAVQVWKELAGALIVVLGVLYLLACVRELARTVDWPGLRQSLMHYLSAVLHTCRK